MASTLGKGVVNLNETIEIDLQSELLVNDELYKNYRNAYIKKEGTEEFPFWQIVSNKLKQMEK